MELLQELFGNHTWQFHIAGFLFALIGSLLVKYHFYRLNKIEKLTINEQISFSFKYFMKKNWEDIIISIVSAFVFLRFLDTFMRWLNPKIEAAFEFSLPTTEDHVFYYLAIGGLVQYWIHKKYKKRRQTL